MITLGKETEAIMGKKADEKAENARKILATGSCEDIYCEHCYLYDAACEVNPEIGIGAAEREYLTTRLARYDAKQRCKATESYANCDITVEERIKRLRKRAKEVYAHFGVEGKALNAGEFDASLLANEVLSYLDVLDRTAPQTLPQILLARYTPTPQAIPQAVSADPPPFDPATATYPLMMMVLRSMDQSWIGPIMIVSYRKESIAPYTDLNHNIWREARLLTDAEIAALRFRP